MTPEREAYLLGVDAALRAVRLDPSRAAEARAAAESQADSLLEAARRRREAR